MYLHEFITDIFRIESILNCRFTVLIHHKGVNIMVILSILLKVTLHRQQDKDIHNIHHDHLVDTCLLHLDHKDHLHLINMEVMVISHPHNKIHQ